MNHLTIGRRGRTFIGDRDFVMKYATLESDGFGGGGAAFTTDGNNPPVDSSCSASSIEERVMNASGSAGSTRRRFGSRVRLLSGVVAFSLGVVAIAAPSGLADTASFTTANTFGGGYCQTWTVPGEVTSAQIQAVGGLGGPTELAGNPGNGDGASATLSGLSPGQLLDVCVAYGQGAGIGSGGGASGVSVGSDFSAPVLVAGGGGGGGDGSVCCSQGGSAGSPAGGNGSAGKEAGGTGGTGGSQTMGGTGGSSGGGTGACLTASGPGVGGGSGDNGGGGGGGYCGGGAGGSGSNGGAGGGGSDFCSTASSVTGCSISAGAGDEIGDDPSDPGMPHVTLTYTAPSPNLFATVTASGQVVDGGNVARVTHLGTGRYEVTFNRDIAGCAYVASTEDVGSSGLLVFTAGGHTQPTSHGVYVEVKNQGGGLTDGPFDLFVDCGATGTQYAVVNYSGHLTRGTSGTIVRQVGTGAYDVFFPTAVSSCAYLATVGDPGNALVFNPSVVATGSGSHSHTVYVETKNLGGGLASGIPFHLAVVCPNAGATKIAVVGADGTIARGSPGTSASNSAAGTYNVTTHRLIAGRCATVATRGSTDTSVPFDPATVQTVPGSQVPASASETFGVETRALSAFGGALQNEAFHAAIVC